MRTVSVVIALSMCIVVSDLAAWASHTLSATQQQILNSWLARHPTYRVASDEDCGCGEDIRDMWSGYGGTVAPVPDYHPYRANGDFNGDGIIDVAVVVIDQRKFTRKFVLLVFNGPMSVDKSTRPTFEKPNLELAGKGLFFYAGPGARLVVGRFESEGIVLEPRGRSYVAVGL